MPITHQLEDLISCFNSTISTRQPETKKAREYILPQLRTRGANQQEIASRQNVSRKTI